MSNQATRLAEELRSLVLNALDPFYIDTDRHEEINAAIDALATTLASAQVERDALQRECAADGRNADYAIEVIRDADTTIDALLAHLEGVVVHETPNVSDNGVCGSQTGHKGDEGMQHE